MFLQDQIALVIAYREFAGDIAGYASAHEYKTPAEAIPSFEVGRTLNTEKFIAFSDKELKLISHSI